MTDEKRHNGNRDMAAEPVAMIYGMSDLLVSSGLLTQISDLSTQDKKCLIRYISEEVAYEEADDDEDGDSLDTDLPPYTLDELYARIQESEEQISRGEYFTEEQVRKELKEEFLWLQ